MLAATEIICHTHVLCCLQADSPERLRVHCRGRPEGDIHQLLSAHSHHLCHHDAIRLQGMPSLEFLYICHAQLPSVEQYVM